MNRRQFLGNSALLSLVCGFELPFSAEYKGRILFASRGRTGMINIDGSGLQFFDFNIPEQVTWQPVAFFPCGEKLLLLSMEARRDGPGKPFAEYYTKTPTHIWSYDPLTKQLTELATRNRLAVFYAPALLLEEGRILVQVSKNQSSQVFNMNLDGSDAFAFTQPEDGVPYGLSLSPDSARVSFHIAGPEGYQIFVSDTDGKNRKMIRGAAGRLFFGTSWSPDGRWILYVDCDQSGDAGHDWADVCISSPDGTESHSLTSGQAMWFAATYGSPECHGGGSNLPAWTKDGEVIFPMRLPGSKTPWEFQTQRVDTDHFNRDYRPERASGGVEICRINVLTRKIKPLTQPGAGFWDFRASQSPDGKHIVFCRAETGRSPELRVINDDGSNERMLTQGFEDLGVDHPKWFPSATIK